MIWCAMFYVLTFPGTVLHNVHERLECCPATVECCQTVECDCECLPRTPVRTALHAIVQPIYHPIYCRIECVRREALPPAPLFVRHRETFIYRSIER